MEFLISLTTLVVCILNLLMTIGLTNAFFKGIIQPKLEARAKSDQQDPVESGLVDITAPVVTYVDVPQAKSEDLIIVKDE